MVAIILKKQVYFLVKLNSKELYNILILGNYEKPTSQGYFEAFFESTTIDWKDDKRDDSQRQWGAILSKSL